MNEVARTQPASPTSRDDGEKGGVRMPTGQLFRVRDGRVWSFTEQQPPAPPDPVPRPARVAQVLTLAHHPQKAIDPGEYRDRAELARQVGFTRARISHLLDLTLLAPDLQERVLHFEAVDGVEPLAERALRDVVRLESWAEQRRAWATIFSSGGREGAAATDRCCAKAIAANPDA